jgi:hypothetical protein
MDNTTLNTAFFNVAGGVSRADRVARIDALAQLLDSAFVLPGTNIRFGIDALIGLVPGVGDLVSTALSLFIVREARALGAPRRMVARMLGNVALDTVVGVVPLVGDLVDVAWRANRRNVAMLQKHLAREPRTMVGADYRSGRNVR